MVTESLSSGTINLGKSVKDFTRSDELPEFTNVEFKIDDNHSVFAKAVGELVPNTETWTQMAGGSGDSISVSDDEIVLTSNSAVTDWRVRVRTNPCIWMYRQLIGRTVHVSMDVTCSGSGWALYSGIDVMDAPDGGSRKDFKNHQTVNSNGTYNFDYTIGDWFTSTYVSGYIAFSFYLYSTGAATVKISNIRIYVDDDSETTLVANCPFADDAMARRVLNSLSGFHYRPYEATGSRLDMASEYGGTVQINGLGYGIYSQSINFGSECVSNLSAPADQEMEHEFPYVPSTERKFRREVATLRAEIDIRSGEIEAKVEQRVPSEYGNPNSFGWKLQSDNFSVYANGQTVLKVTQGGAEISGKVVATSGTIGGCIIDKNGKLQVSEASISSINAEKITAGFLSVDRIEKRSLDETKLAENSVSNFQLGTDAVQGYNIFGGSVSYGKTDGGVQGYLTQGGNVWSGVVGIRDQLNTTLYGNNLQVEGNIFVRYGNKNLAFRPISFSQGSMRWVLGSVNQ